MKREIKIPTILGLIFLVGSLFVGVYLSQKTITTRSKASGDCQPINPQITNVTNTSFDLFFLTSADCLSNLEVSGRIINDLRRPTASKIHYFQVNNLQGNTEYSYQLINNGVTTSDPTNKVKTATKPHSQTPTSNLAWGKVFNPDMSPAANAIVYLVIPGAMPLSASVTSSGNWNISLANSFTDTKDGWFTPPADLEEDIYVISEDGQTTQLTHNTSANNPVPDIIIGQNFFSVTNNSQTGQFDTSSVTSPNINLTVRNPNEGETISTVNPDFFGTAPLGSKIVIEIESDQKFQDEITSSDGNWRWSPPQSLEPGEHTLTVKSQNPLTLEWQTIVRKFTILPSIDALAFSSSPSAATATPIPTSTPVPTAISTPTPIPPTPTDIVRTAKPSTDSGVPTTGIAFPTITLALASLILIIFSFTFFR